MRKGLIAAALLLQAVVVTAMVYIAMEPLRTGRDVTVTVSGVDPRDLMRGQYVEFVYPFSTVDLSTVSSDLDPYRVFNYGDVVYVTLSGDTEPKPTHVGYLPPNDGLFLKGRIPKRMSGSPLIRLDVDYGIESYFTNPDRAAELDSILRRSNSVRVHLKVDDDGDARIADIEVVE